MSGCPVKGITGSVVHLSAVFLLCLTDARQRLQRFGVIANTGCSILKWDTFFYLFPRVRSDRASTLTVRSVGRDPARGRQRPAPG